MFSCNIDVRPIEVDYKVTVREHLVQLLLSIPTSLIHVLCVGFIQSWVEITEGLEVFHPPPFWQISDFSLFACSVQPLFSNLESFILPLLTKDPSPCIHDHLNHSYTFGDRRRFIFRFYTCLKQTLPLCTKYQKTSVSTSFKIYFLQVIFCPSPEKYTLLKSKTNRL